MSAHLKVYLCIFLGGVCCLIAFMVGPYGVPLFIGWLIISHILDWSLTCEKCGRNFTARTMPLAARGRYAGICTRCRPRQKK